MLSVGCGCTYCLPYTDVAAWIPSMKSKDIASFASPIGINGSHCCFGKRGKTVVILQ